MAGDVLQDVGVTLDEKVEAPVFRDPALPAVFAFVVFLSAERRVLEIPEQEQGLLVKGRLDLFGRLAVGPYEMCVVGQFEIAS